MPTGRSLETILARIASGEVVVSFERRGSPVAECCCVFIPELGYLRK